MNAASRMGWQQQPPAGAQDSGFSPEGRPQVVYNVQGGPTSHAPLSPQAHREQQAAAAMHQQEQRGVSHLQNAAAAASAGALQARAGPMSSPGEVGMPPHMMNAQALTNGNLEKRGPVEFNHAINYVNKIKVCAHSYEILVSIVLTSQRIGLQHNRTSISNFLKSCRLISGSRNLSRTSMPKSHASLRRQQTCWKISSNSSQSLPHTVRPLLIAAQSAWRRSFP
jgi:hypothetical protein